MGDHDSTVGENCEKSNRSVPHSREELRLISEILDANPRILDL